MPKYFTYLTHVLVIFLLVVGGFAFFSLTQEKNDAGHIGSIGSQAIQKIAPSAHQEGSFWESIQGRFGVAQDTTIKVVDGGTETLTNFHGAAKQTASKFINLFSDIKNHTYQDDILLLLDRGIVVGQKNHHQEYKFYPDNYVRRADVLTMLTEAFKHDFVEAAIDLEIKDFKDIDPSHPLFGTIQVADNIGILDILIGNDSETVHLNTFVSQKEVTQIVQVLYALNDEHIEPHALTILNDPDAIIKRGELAHIIASYVRDDHYRQQKLATVEDTPVEDVESRNYALDILADKGILSAQELATIAPESPVSRKQFLSILVTTHHIHRPSVPLYVNNQKYFDDVEEGGKSILTQAKNLGLTAQFEKHHSGKLYLEPQVYVSLDEAIAIIETISPYETDQKAAEDSFVSYGKLAELLSIAYELDPHHEHDHSKQTLGEIWDKLTDML